MKIPTSAERLTWRSANSKRPARVEPAMDFGDGFRPRQARFGDGDERYTLALAGRLRMQVEENLEQPAQPGFECSRTQEADKTTYIGVIQNGQECRAAVATFLSDSGEVQFSEYRWNLAP